MVTRKFRESAPTERKGLAHAPGSCTSTYRLLVGNGMRAISARSLSRLLAAACAAACAFCSALTACCATPTTACSSLWHAAMLMPSSSATVTRRVADKLTRMCLLTSTEYQHQESRYQLKRHGCPILATFSVARV